MYLCIYMYIYKQIYMYIFIFIYIYIHTHTHEDVQWVTSTTYKRVTNEWFTCKWVTNSTYECTSLCVRRQLPPQPPQKKWQTRYLPILLPQKEEILAKKTGGGGGGANSPSDLDYSEFVNHSYVEFVTHLHVNHSFVTLLYVVLVTHLHVTHRYVIGCHKRGGDGIFSKVKRFVRQCIFLLTRVGSYCVSNFPHGSAENHRHVTSKQDASIVDMCILSPAYVLLESAWNLEMRAILGMWQHSFCVNTVLD